jgi:hypothetical protein
MAKTLHRRDSTRTGGYRFLSLVLVTGYYRFEQVTCVLPRVTYAIWHEIDIRTDPVSDEGVYVSLPVMNSMNVLAQKVV